MRRVYRYEIPVASRARTYELTHSPHHVAAIRGPAGGDVVEFWAEHDDQIKPVVRTFQVFGTGHPLPEEARIVATADRVGGFVWHLYELQGDEQISDQPCTCRPGEHTYGDHLARLHEARSDGGEQR